MFLDVCEVNNIRIITFLKDGCNLQSAKCIKTIDSFDRLIPCAASWLFAQGLHIRAKLLFFTLESDGLRWWSKRLEHVLFAVTGDCFNIQGLTALLTLNILCGLFWWSCNRLETRPGSTLHLSNSSQYRLRQPHDPDRAHLQWCADKFDLLST